MPHGYEHEIQVLNPKGEIHTRLGRQGDGLGEFSYSALGPLAFDGKGVLYVRNAGYIDRFEANGRFLGRLTPDAVGHPLDMAIAPDGDLWVLAGNGRVGKLRLRD